MQSVREQTKTAAHVVGAIEEVSAQADRIRAAGRDQQQGNDVVLEQASAMKDMAKQVHRTADEQSRGTRLIVESIENVRGATANMANSVSEQTAARASSAPPGRRSSARRNRTTAGRLESVADVRANAARIDELVEALRSPRS